MTFTEKKTQRERGKKLNDKMNLNDKGLLKAALYVVIIGDLMERWEIWKRG